MAKQKSGLAASEKAIDKTLGDLFAKSSGPVKAPSATRYSALLPVKERKPVEKVEAVPVSEDEAEDDEVLSEISEELDDEEQIEGSDEEEEEDESEDEEGASDEDQEVLEQGDASSDEAAVEDVVDLKKRERKRKRRDEFDDLESKYLRKLADDDEDNAPTEKRRKGESGAPIDEQPNAEQEAKDDTDTEVLPVHESLLQKSEDHPDVDVEKANRTLFLGNVSAEAISSSKAKKQLLTHLATPLSDLDNDSGPHKVESLRFRSTAFATGGMPKRAAYITKSVMSATTKSTNAYVVYSTPLAARAALKALNGTKVLDRHLRVDSVAHPQPIAHRRCVFVGNLGFVDDETILTTNAEGETTTKKRSKVPADIEEGLWRVFGQHAGKVESVRVPRDPKTRVGKGFAYVQFYDGNDVEAALLLNEKKFPPMLPRILRVSRAKDPRKTTLAMERTTKARLEAASAGDAKGKPKSTKYKHKATPEQQSLAGRASRLLGRAGAARQQRELKGRSAGRRDPPPARDEAVNGVAKTPEQIVFEGRRASSRDGKPKDLKFGKGKGGGKKGAIKAKTKGRGARRAAEWRKQGPK